jgi:hypothetical protein
MHELSPILSAKGIQLGLDFNTEFLHHITDEQFHDCLEVIQNISRQSFQPLPLITSITIACNAITYDRASKLIHVSQALGIRTITTETLRIHYKRPGLCTPVYNLSSALNESIHHKLLAFTPNTTSTTTTTAATNNNDNNNDNNNNDSNNNNSNSNTSSSNNTSTSLSSSSAGTTAATSASSLEMLQKAMDACMKLEREFLNKVSGLYVCMV